MTGQSSYFSLLFCRQYVSPTYDAFVKSIFLSILFGEAYVFLDLRQAQYEA